MKARCVALLLAGLGLIIVMSAVLANAGPAAADSGGLWITRLTPTGGTGHPFDILEIQFSGAVLSGTFTLDDVTFSGPGGILTPTVLTRLAGDLYQLDLTGQTGLNSYSLLVGPDVQDTDGQALDQDHDGTPGEPEDAYTGALFSVGVTITGTQTTYDGQNLVIYGNAATIDGDHRFASAAVLGGATLAHSPTTAAAEYRLEMTLTDTLWIEAGAKIDVTGRGYLAGYTLGNTTVGGATGWSGGSYGGLGYAHSGASNWVYGDYRDPEELGSGGGVGATENGEPGGGLVRIRAEAAVIDGSILANGAQGVYPANNGGSGGGIRLEVGTLSGGGVIAANGGVGSHVGYGGGDGGGGRVAVYYDTLDGFDPLTQVTAHGGTNDAAAVGTVYLKEAGGEGQLRLDSHGVATGVWTPLGMSAETAFEVDHLVVSGADVIAAPEHEMPIKANNVSVLNGANLTHRAATASAAYSLQMIVTDTLTVASGAKIDVSGRGYVGGRTLGNTTVGAASGSAGGAYGGLGVAGGYAGSITNWVYGDYRNPNELGSGGGMQFGAGGSGGGLVRIVAGSARIDGQILAGGAYSHMNPAGSGGGIRLEVGTLSGSGSIAASGGTGSSVGNFGGSGGGGRVAVYYDTLDGFDPLTQVTAHGGNMDYGSSPSAVGTVYLKQNGGEGQLRVDSHGAATGEWTPLGMSSETMFVVDHLVVSGANVVAAPEHDMPIKANNVSVLNGANLTHRAATASAAYSLRMIVADTLTVASGAKIDVTGRGYLAGYTLGNTIVGGASGLAGGSYGGLGNGQTNWTYGDYRHPNEVGSGGGLEQGQPGGGLVRITASSAVIEGAILANGATGSYPLNGGGGGGGILLNVGTLSGNGTIAANGGNGISIGYGGGSGGGGRVAVYYWGGMTLPVGHITAAGGTGGAGNGQAGSVYFANTPFFWWPGPADALFHDTERLAWEGLALDPAAHSADLWAFGMGQEHLLGAGLPPVGSLFWNTTAVPAGWYELRAIYRDASGQVMYEAKREVLVNNALAWHSGRLEANETWAADRVHVVESPLSLAPGVTLTVDPGAVVKFGPEASIAVESGAVLNAPATAGQPIVFTALADDTAGGDTNLDGSQTRPRPGSWNGVVTQGSGQFNATGEVELRYYEATHSGTLAGSESWAGTVLHWVADDVTVPNGVVLTIEPGAVVKFSPKRRIVVQSGGQLIAQGTVVQPILFTSLLDDSVGGDTNHDGDSSSPNPGDWLGIQSSGLASLDHVVMTYGAGSETGGYDFPTSTYLLADSGSSVSLRNSVLIDGLYEGIVDRGGVQVENTLIARLDRGINLNFDHATLTNVTIDGNNWGLWCHGGSAQVTNSIISNNTQSGDCGTFRYNDVWPGSYNGQDGNISKDPQFKNREGGNYRLNYRSPAIDAADGTVAPDTDLMGAPRYDDPRTANTGLPTPGSAFADMGAYEFVETAESNIDLVVTNVSGPLQAIAGETVSLTWTIANAGSEQAIGPWHDTVALVFGPEVKPEVLVAGEVLVGQGVRLGPGDSTQVAAQIRVPAGIVADYSWQVETNTRGEVFEGQNRANNIAHSLAPVALDLPELVVGGAALDRQFAAVGESHWFKFIPQAGQDVQVSLDLDESSATELYIAPGYMPTRQTFHYSQHEWNSPDTKALAPATSAQTYYVLAYARSLSSVPASWTIRARALDLALDSVSPTSAGNSGPVTLKLEGGQLGEGMTYQIVGPGGQTRAASSLFWVDSSLVYATFDMAGLPTGLYDVQTAGPAGSASLDDALTLVPGVPTQVAYRVVTPQATRHGRTEKVLIEYTNVGNTDAVAPLMWLEADNGVFTYHSLPPNGAAWTPDSERAWSDVTFTEGVMQGIDPEGPAGVLPPGTTGRLWLDVTTTGTGGFVSIAVHTATDPAAPLDWAAIKDDLKPAWTPGDAWEAVFANFTAQVGSTVGQFQSVLADSATYLSRLGQYTHDATRLTVFELEQAGLGIIADRYTLGALGYGNLAPWEVTAVTHSNGDVSLRSGMFVRYFERQPDGSYRGSKGDYAALTLESGVYKLRGSDGTLLVFRPDGKIDYAEDANGNRVTCEYTGGQMTRLSTSNGDSITYTYNAAGRITQATDSVGRTTTFTYDAANTHLLSISNPRGTTSLTYVTGQGAAREHAIASITYPDGTHTYFEYDEQGRRVRQTRDGGAEEVTIAYDSAYGRTYTDAEGTVEILPTDFASIGLVTNALGDTARTSYNLIHQPIRQLGPLGVSAAYAYDDRGNLSRVLDEVGHQSIAAYDPAISRLLTFQDTRSHITSFGYDGSYNLASITYPDSSDKRFSYDGRGNVTAWTNRRGATIGYRYDAQDLLLGWDLPGGSQVDLAYDSHRNLVAVTEPAGVISFTYDAADRPTRVTYPGGRLLDVSYDAASRRTRIADQDGFTVNDEYDGLGRLARVSGGSGETIVAFSYDAVGRLAREDKGNGTYTTYEYDANGRLLHLVNYAPTSAISSRFDYSYNALGFPTAMATLDGQWSYEYDATGQLTRAVFDSSNPGLANQEINYEYDAAGNRVRVTTNAVPADYTANSLDQYTEAGAFAYEYDADGNLVGKTDGSQTWIYSYDAQNRLVAAQTPDGAWTFEYDAFGHRTAVIHGSERVEYLLDPAGAATVVGAYNGSGNLLTHYVHGLGLAGQAGAAGMTAYYNFDGLGNVVEVTGPGGEVLNRYAYLPFGELLLAEETVSNPFTYIGRQGVMSGAAGELYFMANRWYDPALGRFLQPDPLDLSGQDANLYRYVGNHPTGLVDPLGLCAMPDKPIDASTYWLIQPAGKPFDPNNGIPMDPREWWTVKDFRRGGPTFTWSQGIGGKRLATWGSGKLMTMGETFHVTYDAVEEAGYAPEARSLPIPIDTLKQRGWVVAEEATEFGMKTVTYRIPFYVASTVANVAAWVLVGGDIAIGIYSLQNPNPAPEDIFTPAVLFSNKYNMEFRRQWGLQPRTYPIAASRDPNDKVTVGVGPQGWIAPGTPLFYTIDFENVMTATAAAQEVLVTDQLDGNLDWSTFELGQVHFNNVAVDVPASLQACAAEANVSTDPDPVQVTASLDADSGVVTWDLKSIDPVTGQLVEDPLAGFLPPNDDTHRGEGFVTFSIWPKGGLPDGAEIHNQARIVFDVNPFIDTNVVVNTIDDQAPTSAVTSLPATRPVTFTVSWSGSDGTGSGIAAYDVYVSADEGAFAPWQESVTTTQALFTGTVGSTYGFYSVATDNVGHRQPTPSHAQASTLVTPNGLDVSIAGLSAANDGPTPYGSLTTLTATITAGTSVSYTWALGDGQPGSGVVVTHTYPAAGIYTAVVTASNPVSLVTATTTVEITSISTYIYLPIVVRNH